MRDNTPSNNDSGYLRSNMFSRIQLNENAQKTAKRPVFGL
jgi:hypothetical protein